jgi:hypothetical protein
VERQQRGKLLTNNSKGKDTNERKNKKSLDASDLLIETGLFE